MSLYGYKPKTKKAPWTRCKLLRQATELPRSKSSPNGSSTDNSVTQKPISRWQRRKDYSRRRRLFLEKPENKLCRVCADCLKLGQVKPPHVGKRIRPTQDVHHAKGRGKYLLDESTWLPVCRWCHDFIHNNVKWSYENHYMEPRI